MARFVALALVDAGVSHAVIDLGGPENMTFNELVGQIERPFRPDIAGMMEAGITFDTSAMSFDAADLRSRFPHVELGCVADVVGQHFGAPLQR
ncbi:MAG: hypothetical protein JO023_25070 [Chloroflexi bacterium]|nr:hypothetical protein [Chloroflexota bacterium]